MRFVRTSVDGAVARLTLDRPEARNALSAEMCDEIVTALEALDRVEEARSIVVHGAGPAFCAGADFAAVSGPGGLTFLPAFERMLEATARHRLPTIAALHGAALGGGLQLATACDFRIAAADVKVGIPSARLGILVNLENVRRLVLVAGVAVAKEVLMTARTYTGDEALAAGLVHRCVPATDLDRVVAETAAGIARLAPLSVQGSKRAIRLVADDLSDPHTSRPDDAAEIDRLVTAAYASADLQEGIAAMQEKRDPRFEGR